MEENEKKVRKTKTKSVPLEEEKVEIKEVVVEKKSGFNYAEVIVIMIITLILGGVLGSFITYISKDNTKEVRTIIKENNKSTTLPSEFNEFLNTYENIINNYYEDVDSNKLIEAGINGMLEYLGDDYSVYMDQDVSELFNQQVEGKYQGVGIEIMLKEDKSIAVNRVFKDSPAEKAGVQANDIIVSVDGESVEGKTPTEIATTIKKKASGKVELVVKRNEEEKKFNLTLKEVQIESVEGKVIEKNNKKIGYIQLSVFAANTYPQFKAKLQELEKQNIDSLIIDVRGNSGGYLSSVTDIASLFLNKSKIIYQLDTKGVVEQIYATSKESRDYDIVVLIDEGSASASEILAGALQESYKATVIGKNSFGKGTVQTAYQLKSGATVKYTIQKWLTPEGNWINEVGITPDIEVGLTEEYAANPCDDTDAQLQKALEELSK